MISGHKFQSAKKWLQSKFFLLAIIIVLSFLGLNFYQLWQQKRLVDLEINTLQQKMISVTEQNQELSQLIDYLNSTAYLEKRARADLNLKKTGEQAVVVSANQVTDELSDQQLSTSQTLSNPKKWWRYFFNIIK